MQFSEAIATDVASDKHDKDCYFCNKKKEERSNKNDFEDDYPEDDDLDGLEPDGIKFKNSSKKLTSAMKEECTPKQADVQGKSLKVSCAAHHLIPGNGSLKVSDLYESKEYLWTDGEVDGNIGYDVNSSPNGEFLPGNYAMRPWGERGAAFKKTKKIEPKDYAFAAIEIWQKQFHDAHGDYNTFVMNVLNEIFKKLDKDKSVWCPKAKKEDDDPKKRDPLYVLVNRLHTVSARMRKMLKFPLRNWKINVFTSDFSLQYMQSKKSKKR